MVESREEIPLPGIGPVKNGGFKSGLCCRDPFAHPLVETQLRADYTSVVQMCDDGGGGGTDATGVVTSSQETAASSEQERRFPPERAKTFIALCILACNFVLNTLSLAIVHDKVPDRETYKPLPDVVLDAVPAHDLALYVSEILIITNTHCMLLLLLLHRHRFIVFRRLFVMLSLLYLMRSITMFVTVLPVASKTYDCSPKQNTTSVAIIANRTAHLLFGMGLTINGQHTYCGDYMYSGHTVVLVMSCLMICEYSSKRFYVLHGLLWMLTLAGVACVLVSHGHYTVDVLVAYFITTRVFWIYHTCCNNDFLKRTGPRNYIGREWWFPLFQYFEGNVKGPVPLEYSWPFGATDCWGGGGGGDGDRNSLPI